MKHTLQCEACGHNQESAARPGKTVPCGQCQAPIKVPFERGAGQATAFACPSCGQEISTATKAGKKMRCRSCQAEIRVPLSKPAEGPSHESEARKRHYEKRPTRGLDRDRGSLADRWKVRRMAPGRTLVAGLVVTAAGPLLTLVLSQLFYGGLVFAPLALVPFGLALIIDGILRSRRPSEAEP